MDLSSVIRTVAARLNAEFEGTTDLHHRASKGRVRETIVMAEVLKRVLPETIGVLQGAEIVCSDGTVSNECDLVAYDRSIPPIYRSTTYSVLPIESVLGVIEVKSSLDKKELRDAAKKLHEIRLMPRTALHRPPGDTRQVIRYGRPWDFAPVRAYVVAFRSSELSGLADELQEVERGWIRWECLDAVYVMNKGYLLDASSLGNQRQQFDCLLDDNALLTMVVELLSYLPRGFDPIFNSAAYLGQVPLGIAIRSFGEWNQDGSQV
jgi:hypothetical protein